ncbi:hypothetical protein MKEN_00413000 [Mycena kentingensis (nom. inval.)]|nr:hypothetical protein MKEN_00413000 [Mycena kentingensis (nom. inval.)]
MLARLAGELLPAARCPKQFSEALESFCDGARSADLRVVLQQLVRPCLNAKTPVQVYPLDGEDSLRSVGVHFHDNERLDIVDYFTGLGYILSLQPYDFSQRMERVKLLALYAKLCKLSAAHVGSRAPTTVQILWPKNDPRIALAASLSWFKPRQHFQLARSARETVLRDLWGCNALVHPSPMQVRFPNPVGTLFGTCWGDCAEAISVSAFWKQVVAGTPLRTLALNVASITTLDTETGLSASDAILAEQTTLQDAFQILRRSQSLRPMCKNCEHLHRAIGAHVLDYADPHRVTDSVELYPPPAPTYCYSVPAPPIHVLA